MENIAYIITQFSTEWKKKSAQFAPFLVDLINVVRTSAGTKFTLRNTSAILPEVVVYALHSVINVRKRSVRQQMLPVNLTPEGNPAAVRAQIVNAHAEQLRVDGIQTDTNPSVIS